MLGSELSLTPELKIELCPGIRFDDIWALRGSTAIYGFMDFLDEDSTLNKRDINMHL